MPSFADRFRKRRGLDTITGYSGGSLQDQLNEPPPRQPMQFLQSPQPTMADQYMATAEPEQPVTSASRPRSVNPFLERFTNDPSRQERPREVNPTDEVTKSSDYLRQIQDKPLGLRDKFGLVAQNIATNLGGTPLATRRQRDIAKAGQGLQQDLAVQGQQYKSQALQSQMDAREASARAAEERIRQGDARLDETKRRNNAYIGHVNDLPKEKQAEAARKMYMAGVADGDPEFKATLARRMGITEELPDTDKGTVQVDDKGNYIVVRTRTNSATPVTQPVPVTPPQQAPQQVIAPAETAPPARKPVGSFKATQETRKDERARLGRAAAMDRAIVMAGARSAAMGDPEEYGKWATESDEDAKTALAKAEEAGPRHAGPYLAQANAAKARATRLRELETKARGAQSPQGTMQSAPKRVFNESAFKAAFQKKHGRQPTEAEILPYRNAP